MISPAIAAEEDGSTALVTVTVVAPSIIDEAGAIVGAGTW